MYRLANDREHRDTPKTGLRPGVSATDRPLRLVAAIRVNSAPLSVLPPGTPASDRVALARRARPAHLLVPTNAHIAKYASRSLAIMELRGTLGERHRPPQLVTVLRARFPGVKCSPSSIHLV